MYPLLLQLGIYVTRIPGSSASPDSVPSVPEDSFCRSLSKAAASMGILLFLFSPEELSGGKFYSYRLQGGVWKRELSALPDLIYDRCFYKNNVERMRCRAVLRALHTRKPHLMLSGELPSKWDVYVAWKDDVQLSPYLPQTQRYDTLLRACVLCKEQQLFLKPSSGMQGKGVIHLSYLPYEQQWKLAGRTRRNRPFEMKFSDQTACEAWIVRFIGNTKYLIQPYLELTGTDRKPFDVRALVQKDDKGRWQMTGTAVRTGATGSVTSNLHGGGDSSDAAGCLASLYGARQAEELLQQIGVISELAAERLEGAFGRYAEFGLDFGIEPSGRLWLIEANSKPGRACFRLQPDIQKESLERPLRYARLLSRRLAATRETPIFPLPSIRQSSRDANENPTSSDNVQEVHP
ncbi:YheC/YheD family protein [Paenibacillus sp. GCM10023252]|uniref:YheC/YheD family endospore coat-associated protein n=1 Tax=Paenibacillus sp. GCM10023252 TaxID=3252649 RepID=UPI0036135F3A